MYKYEYHVDAVDDLIVIRNTSHAYENRQKSSVDHPWTTRARTHAVASLDMSQSGSGITVRHVRVCSNGMIPARRPGAELCQRQPVSTASCHWATLLVGHDLRLLGSNTPFSVSMRAHVWTKYCTFEVLAPRILAFSWSFLVSARSYRPSSRSLVALGHAACLPACSDGLEVRAAEAHDPRSSIVTSGGRGIARSPIVELASPIGTAR